MLQCLWHLGWFEPHWLISALQMTLAQSCTQGLAYEALEPFGLAHLQRHKIMWPCGDCKHYSGSSADHTCLQVDLVMRLARVHIIPHNTLSLAPSPVERRTDRVSGSVQAAQEDATHTFRNVVFSRMLGSLMASTTSGSRAYTTVSCRKDACMASAVPHAPPA